MKAVTNPPIAKMAVTTTTTKPSGGLCTSSNECPDGPCKNRCCREDNPQCTACDDSGYCSASVQADGSETQLLDDSKCEKGEYFTEEPVCKMDIMSGQNKCGQCWKCPRGKTQLPGTRDVCENCKEDHPDTVFTKEGSQGTCSDLVSAEAIKALTQTDGKVDKGTIIGIVLSLVIACIGGVIMYLKRHADHENQQHMLRRLEGISAAQGTLQRQSMSLAAPDNAAPAVKKKKKSSKKKRTGGRPLPPPPRGSLAASRSAKHTVTSSVSNPMYNHEGAAARSGTMGSTGGGYIDVGGAEGESNADADSGYLGVAGSSNTAATENVDYDGNQAGYETVADYQTASGDQEHYEGFSGATGSSSADMDVYNPPDDSVESQCTSQLITGKECREPKYQKSEYCKKHTCNESNCNRLKSSRVEHCKKCTAGGGIEL